jgi:hypothetical protein
MCRPKQPRNYPGSGSEEDDDYRAHEPCCGRRAGKAYVCPLGTCNIIIIVTVLLAIIVAVPVAVTISRSSTQAREAMTTVSAFTTSALEVAGKVVGAASLSATSTWADVMEAMTLPRCTFSSGPDTGDVWAALSAPSMHGALWARATEIRYNVSVLGITPARVKDLVPALVRRTLGGRIEVVLFPASSVMAVVGQRVQNVDLVQRTDSLVCAPTLDTNPCKDTRDTATTPIEALFFVLFEAATPQTYSPGTTVLQAPLLCV